MFEEIKGGSKEEIQGLTCWNPPVGIIWDHLNGGWIDIGVHSRSDKPEEQYWERQEVPEWYTRQRPEEREKQEKDPFYFDSRLEDYRREQWTFRLGGFWFYNNGKPTYLSPLNWFYLQWWKIDIGYPSFREPDRKMWHFAQYCIEDPDSLGMVDSEKRRGGKTFKGGLFCAEYPMRASHANGGIQSKTEGDAKKVFHKAIVSPWRALPHFFRPVYDTAQGTIPKTKIQFTSPSRKGKKSLDTSMGKELGGLIDFTSSGVHSYDGPKIHRLLVDEVGKLEECSAWERHEVARYCMEQDGEFIGKAFLTTTVEEAERGGGAFEKLWRNSDQYNGRNELNRTLSGLYRYFTPADQTMYFDIYGFPDVDRAREHLRKQFAAYKHDLRSLYNAKRRNPLEEADMFRVIGDACSFNAEKLNERLDELSWGDKMYIRGNFVWEVKDEKVKFVQNNRGKFLVAYQFDSKDKANNVVRRGERKSPGGTFQFVAGVDPYDHDVTDSNKASKGAAYMFRKGDSAEPMYSRAAVVQYISRPQMSKIFYEDILMMCFYYGANMLFEQQKPGIGKYFQERGYGDFLIYLPGRKSPGIHMSKQVHQEIVERIQEYTEEDTDKILFKDLINDLLKFNVHKTQKYDATMAFGITLIADAMKAMRKARKPQEGKGLFRKFKAKAY